MKKLFFITFLIVGLIAMTASLNFALGQTGSSVDPEITALNAKIEAQKNQITSLATKQKAYQSAIIQAQNNVESLTSQLSVLNDQAASMELDIESTNLEISNTNLEINKIQLDSSNISAEIDTAKQKIATLLEMAYQQDQVSTLEMLLSNNSLSDFLNQFKYLENTNAKINEEVDTMTANKAELDKNQASLVAKNQQLSDLKAQLESKKSDLVFEQQSKTSLLTQTKSSQQTYQSLLDQAKQQELQAENEVASIEKTVREKMSAADKNQLDKASSMLIWPVPKNTITTYFHDPSYPFRKILGEHPAIDIRAPYQTPLKAAADGYVARVKFDGTPAYAYIMIVHNNGFSTVYGHVSAVYVKADQYVHQGDIIGLSGALPGAPGSGPFTTGPHLHFEVRKDGIPVNPLDYLP
jgi:murein DD-endopeptidase MepM/ murein hydrolase activator NlpD